MEGVQTHGWRTALAGSQMLFVAFGALVLMPLITGMNPSVALFTAGIGTLLFQFTTRRQIPIFLASSFAFIAPIMYSNQTWGLPATLGGLVAAGVVYILLSLLVRLWGPGFIQRLLPPVVVGPVIMVIGLGLASVAVNMAMGKAGDGSAQLVEYNTAILIAGASLITTIIVAVFAKGIFRLVPILAGVLVGYALSWLLGVTDFTQVAAAPWLAVPDFVTPEFQLAAILFMIPVAIAPAIEHIGDVLAIGGVTGKNYLEKPGLQNTLLGDGIATSAAAFFGGPPNTTYSEVTGAVMLTRNFNPNVMIWAAVFAIVLAFIDKFGAVLLGMPVPVMGGILCLLFGSIAVVGLNTLVRHQVDLSQARNLCIVSVTLVFGIGGMVIGNDSFSLQGISLCGVVAILLNLILPKADEEAPAAH
ncbi:uracil-xanthine permease family protein [Halopseudomonas aestusnigri]|jgi:uracil permease|uniref:uracil-xanthine permease family protein n=1 Tax=Halopseudomonas TaxID=2901189 RepID=UPI000C95686C|nr:MULTISPECIES: uracil-xanthine permease family protein [Halopseudomonas]MAH00650.1 uracil permease [Pseudomonadales bacterium]MEE2798994.1 uracil-xanthine permease family protein [Pseudomonadota bacterium]MAP77263.1 uracil permease [Pseudomonadales bacterium]MAS65813.1 uracil permease [Pseudomonadales bacterium]MCC4261243.1 uracil-xanthine permease family protein [Halopseudomonas aestusnigri]|tara:strand:- start:1075 stop:2322 length:1248 start_codon:yes stop_codon:yes gene_type:complete